MAWTTYQRKKRMIQMILKKEKIDDSTYNTGFKDVPEKEKPRLEATERKLTKYGYDTGIRVVYLGKGEKFKKDKLGEIKNAFKQFNAPNLNSFDAYTRNR
jgi:hypothetical protein